MIRVAAMKKHTIVTLVFQLLLTSARVSALKYCHDGTYEIVGENNHRMCVPCPEETYMPEYDHRHTACYNCNKTQSHLELVYSPCTRKKDAVIHCVEGYYRDLPRNSRDKETCKKCTECQHTGRPCQTYSNTICCPYENSEVVLHKDGYLTCKEKPYLCMKGQYLVTSVNECLPCPSDTYMPSDLHVMTECLKCPHYNLPLHAEMIQSCNSTHAPVVACKKGFYMNHAMGYKDSSIGCSPCRDCNKASLYEGRACDGLHDTVCCPQPNMTVRDMPGGPLCQTNLLEIQTSAPPPVPCCEEDQHQISDLTNNSITCQPCPTTPSSRPTDQISNRPSCENCTTESRNEQLLTNQTLPKTLNTENVSDDFTSPHILYPVIAVCVILLLVVGASIYLYCRYRRNSYSPSPVPQDEVFDLPTSSYTCGVTTSKEHTKRTLNDAAERERFEMVAEATD